MRYRRRSVCGAQSKRREAATNGNGHSEVRSQHLAMTLFLKVTYLGSKYTLSPPGQAGRF